MKHSMRNWHTWGSLVLGVPLLLVGLTTFFIAHDKALGTKDIMLPIQGAGYEEMEIRSSLQQGAEQWIGTKQGVFRVENGKALLVEGAPTDEIRDMVSAGDAVLMAGKKALWRMEGAAATKVFKGDCWQVAAHATGYSAACKDVGLLASADGKAWSARAVEFPEEVLTALPKGMALSKVIMDMHTGKLFFGKEYEWIWIDLLGLACVALGITGLVMWMRSRRQRAGVAG
ncbi:MAG: PepSY domain-containing protein [Rhodoferax sp.]|nr:PepSY domain-containing protein [Rhodoferax sp.]MDZ7918588.1 PepSY domain-containing protein [Rhodoferax sp.]